jgi:hypothetical protein
MMASSLAVAVDADVGDDFAGNAQQLACEHSFDKIRACIRSLGRPVYNSDGA